MGFLDWLRRTLASPRDPSLREQLAAWRTRPAPAPTTPIGAVRWVVVDVESSGLDVWRDRLISIGAVALHGEVLVLSDSLEVVLRQAEVSETANILVHGIGATAQQSGLPPARALLDFLAFTGGDPLVAFHAAFDTVMIGRALRSHLGLRWRPLVIDLADLLPALFPQADCRDLDAWAARFGIRHDTRHQALSDAYATAQLLQVALAASRVQGHSTLGAVDRLQRQQRALQRLGAPG